ncbi:MAG: S8 family serine peptidase [Calditrichaeota bacterium]|nr:S8 family serine peptidase [Calditrichota bacterium]
MTCTRRTYLICFFLIALMQFAVGGDLFSENKKKGDSFDPLMHSRRIIVKFTESVKFASQKGKIITTASSALDSLNQIFGVSAMRPVYPALADFPQSVKEFFSKLFVIEFSREIDVADALEKYSRLSAVDFVEPDYFYFSTFSEPAARQTPERQLSLRFSQKEQSQSLKIAILSPDGSGLFAAPEILLKDSAEKRDGKLKFYGGLAMVDFVGNCVRAWAGDLDEKYSLKILPLRAGTVAASGAGEFSASGIARSVMSAAQKKAGVIVLPFWGYGVSQTLEAALAACDSMNCVLVAAAGEENSGAPVYPAAFKNVLAVSAVNLRGEKIPSANYGDYIDLSAAGYFSQWETIPDSLQRFLSPTILAAGHVAAAAAILRAEFPDLMPREIRERLIFSCDNIYFADAPTFGALLGAGKLNPGRAMKGVRAPNIIVKKMNFRNEIDRAEINPGNRVAIFFELQNLSAEAHNVRIRLLVSDAMIGMDRTEITLEKLGFGEIYANKTSPLQIRLPSHFPENYQPQVLLSVETAEGFRTQRALRLRKGLVAPQEFHLQSANPITLVWKKNPAFAGYKVYRKNAFSGDYFQLLTKEPLSDSLFIDSAAEIGILSEYYVTGVDSIGRESVPAKSLQARFIPPPEFSFSPADTAVFVKDSIEFQVSLTPPDSLYSLHYFWFLNDSLRAEGKKLILPQENFFAEKDTLRLQISDSGGAVVSQHIWLLQREENFPVEKPEIVQKYPPADTTILFPDSLSFSVSLRAAMNDSVRFLWFVSDSLAAQGADSFFIFQPAPEMTPPETIRVHCEVADTVLSQQWVVNWDLPVQKVAAVIFSPARDTTIFVGDTLLLEVNLPEKIDSLFACFWGGNGETDSSESRQRFLFAADSAGTDTIICRYFSADSERTHQWVISILRRNSPPLLRANFSPGDTTLFVGDTLKFLIQVSDAEEDSLRFLWQVNGVVDSTADSLSFVFLRQEVDSAETDTVSFIAFDADTSVQLDWVVSILERKNHPPIFKEIFPDSQFVVLKNDSCLFSVSCVDADSDSVSFRWWVDGKFDSSAHDSSFLFKKSDLTDSLTRVKVAVGDGKDSTIYVWEVRSAQIDTAPSAWRFFPAQDTIFVAAGDSVIFGAENADSTIIFNWTRDAFPDSIFRGADYIFRSQPTFLQEIVSVRAEKNDWQKERQWVVVVAPDTALTNLARIMFFPENDSIFAAPGDSIRFLVRVPRSQASTTFFWKISSAKGQLTGDSALVRFIADDFQAPETLRVKVQLSDSVHAHQWIIFAAKKTLPVPIILSPDRERRVSEFDAFRWQPDSNLTKSAAGKKLKYVIQLSADSSFSEIFSSDTVQTTQFSLSDCSQLEKLKPEKILHWRVRVLAGDGESSPFALAKFPIVFYPEFSTVAQFGSEIQSDGIALSWQLSYRGKCRGFNLYRKNGENGDFVKVNEHLISGGAEFHFTDNFQTNATVLQYKLEEISQSNRKKEHQTIRVEMPLPNDYSLSQNSPNPFNSSTSFRFEIPRATHVAIEVYNILGKKVRTLINERREAGFYTVYWDGIDDNGEQVGSGIYFYNMAADQFHATHKMIVVR